MTTVNTYLTFEGNCEAAFEFYRSAFGGEFLYVGRFGDIPAEEGFELNDEEKQKIMHMTLPIGNTRLMGSDTGGEWSKHYKHGNNFSISINTDSKDEANRLFDALSAGGKVTMPMADTFWDSYFGMFIDKFGIQWMVSYDRPME